jgi:hypothetical protein
MKHIHTHFIQLTGSVLALATLAACGGGGGDGGNGDAPAADPAPQYTQSEIRSVAALGALATDMTAVVGSQGIEALGSVLYIFSADTGGTRTVARNDACESGTLEAQVSKANTQTGLGAGDQVALRFQNCSFGGAVLHGSATLKTRQALVFTGDTIDESFEATLSNFTITRNNLAMVYTGAIEAKFNATEASNRLVTEFRVPAAKTFGWKAAKLVLAYEAGTTFAGTDVLSPNTLSRKLDGRVSIGTDTPVPLVITTPAALTGTRSQNGGFVPTAGSLKTVADDLETSIVSSGNTLTVSGDTDGNGSLDLSFNTTWTELTAP